MYHRVVLPEPFGEVISTAGQRRTAGQQTDIGAILNRLNSVTVELYFIGGTKAGAWFKRETRGAAGLMIVDQ
jgi:hypothetical protein